MKLISCHIENFGKLHDCSWEFCDGANLICEENGWGKSTFAAFIRAMFYGLEGERKRSLAENERKRYKPWQGGIFGGQLVFEIGGRTYQISRIFADKEAKDEFELRDAKTNVFSDAYSKKIGEEIFKINRESFLRTVFIGQKECETSATDDINAKIGNFADNANDLNRYEAANARLTEILNALTPLRATGSIAKRREEIARYERVMQGGMGISESIDKYQAHLHAEEELLENLKARMKEAVEQQARVSKRQAALAKKSEWERLKRNVSGKKEENEACRRAFSGEVPSLEEVKRKIVECGEMERVYERMQAHQLSETEEVHLSELEGRIAEDVPGNGEQGGQLEALHERFVKEQKCASAMMKNWSERNSRKKALPSNKAAYAALKASMKAAGEATKEAGTGRRKLSPLLLLGIGLAVIGIIVAVSAHPAAGLCIVVAGAGLLLAGELTSGRAAKSAGKGGTKSSGEGKEARPLGDGTGAGAWENGTGAGAWENGTDAGAWEDGTDAELSGGGENVGTQADAELENLQREIAGDEAFIARVDEEMADYLAARGREFDEGAAADDLQEIMEELYAFKNKVEKYAALKEKRENFERAVEEFKKVGSVVATFLDGLGLEPSEHPSAQLEEVRELVERHQNAARAFGEAKDELERFVAENDVEGLARIEDDESLPSLEELSRQMRTLNDEMEKAHHSINEYHNTLEDLQRQYDEWEECGSRLTGLKERQAAEQKKYDYVFKARVKLGLAKEAMTAKYVAPILNGFGEYYKMISGHAADRFHVDANTTVTVDELGRQRDIVSLSSGYQDLVGICLRMALVDAMYKEEIPFLVMDDPFANLDDGKVAAARKFVEELGKTYQVLYFTCSHARG